MCMVNVLRCMCDVLGHLAPVHRYARSLCYVACAVSWATLLLFTGVYIRRVVLCVRCPLPFGPCSLVCTLGVWCCVCRVPGHVAPVHRCACSVRCAVSAVSWANLLLFSGVYAQRVVLCVRCPWLLCSCSSVCTLVACVWRCCGVRTGPSRRRLFCSRLGLGTLQARTNRSRRPLFSSRQELDSLPDPHTSIRTAAGGLLVVAG